MCMWLKLTPIVYMYGLFHVYVNTHAETGDQQICSSANNAFISFFGFPYSLLIQFSSIQLYFYSVYYNTSCLQALFSESPPIKFPVSRMLNLSRCKCFIVSWLKRHDLKCIECVQHMLEISICFHHNELYNKEKAEGGGVEDGNTKLKQ